MFTKQTHMLLAACLDPEASNTFVQYVGQKKNAVETSALIAKENITACDSVSCSRNVKDSCGATKHRIGRYCGKTSRHLA